MFKHKNDTVFGTKLWFCALWLMFLHFTISYTPYNIGYVHLFSLGTALASILLCLYKIFLIDQSDALTRAFQIAVLAYLAANVLLAGTLNLLYLFCLVISCKDVSFRKIAKAYLAFFLFYLAFSILKEYLGIQPPVSFPMRHVLPFLPTYCLTLGLGHYNDLGMWLMAILLMYILIRYQNRRLSLYFAGFAYSFVLFFLTSSRTSFLISFLSVFLLAWQYLRPKDFERIPKIQIFSAALILLPIVLMFLCMIFYTPENALLQAVNHLLSGRIYLGWKCIYEYGLSLFGTSEPVSIMLDFLFLSLAYSNGIVGSALYATLLVISAYRAIKYKQWDVWIVIIMFTMYGLSEYGFRSSLMMMLYPAFAKLDE